MLSVRGARGRRCPPDSLGETWPVFDLPQNRPQWSDRGTQTAILVRNHPRVGGRVDGERHATPRFRASHRRCGTRLETCDGARPKVRQGRRLAVFQLCEVHQPKWPAIDSMTADVTDSGSCSAMAVARGARDRQSASLCIHLGRSALRASTPRITSPSATAPATLLLSFGL